MHLIEDHPVGVDLGVSLWVQHHGLVGPEVGQGDLGVLRAVVDDVNDAVLVKVPFALVSNSVPFKNKPPSQCSGGSRRTRLHVHARGATLTVRVLLLWVGHQPAVVVLVQHAVIVVIVITLVSLWRAAQALRQTPASRKGPGWERATTEPFRPCLCPAEKS